MFLQYIAKSVRTIMTRFAEHIVTLKKKQSVGVIVTGLVNRDGKAFWSEMASWHLHKKLGVASCACYPSTGGEGVRDRQILGAQLIGRSVEDELQAQ